MKTHKFKNVRGFFLIIKLNRLDELVEEIAEQEFEFQRRSVILENRKYDLSIIEGINQSIEQVCSLFF